jgi:hypothetical protein
MSIRLLAIACLSIACATAGNSATGDGSVSDGPADDAPLTSDANTCAMQPCTILPQCGCVGACDIDGDDLDGGQCRNVNANAQMEGGACSVAAGCVAGAVCLGGGVCRKYCDANADCGQPRGQCLITITNNDIPVPNVPKTCSSNCDPTNVAAGGCPNTHKCSLFTVDVGGVDNNIVDCAPVTGTGTQGVNCKAGANGNEAVCGKDHTCVTGDGGTTFTCRRMCVVGGVNVCGGGTCTAFGTPFLVGGINYGVCVP